MVDSNQITDTEARLWKIFDNITTNAIESSVPQKIEKAIDDISIRTGVITKFYRYLDKAEVRLDYNNELVLCKILHRYGGDITDYYTPLAHEEDFDEKLHEPYVVPKAQQCVCVLKIHDKDSEENLILGYYHNTDIIGYNPAKPGNIKLMCMCEDNLYWVKFGIDGFDYRGISAPTMKVGEDMRNMEELNNVTQEQVYTKEEVDELLNVYEERIRVLEEELGITSENTDGTNEDNNNNDDDSGG